MTVGEFKQQHPVGQRVRIAQMIDRREGDWQAEVEGVIDNVELQKTGSWYAHSKDDKLWLLRVHLRKDDGELSIINVDTMTNIEAV